MNDNIDNQLNKDKKYIIRTWLAGHCYCHFGDSEKITKEYGLD